VKFGMVDCFVLSMLMGLGVSLFAYMLILVVVCILMASVLTMSEGLVC